MKPTIINLTKYETNLNKYKTNYYQSYLEQNQSNAVLFFTKKLNSEENSKRKVANQMAKSKTEIHQSYLEQNQSNAVLLFTKKHMKKM